jgi:ubiquinone/menaquinone biosynthesis C-methylase UbiE
MTSGNALARDPMRDDEPGRRRLARLATKQAARRQRRVWSGRVATWDRHGSSGLATVTAAVLAAAELRPGAVVVDLGCGTGQVSLPLAWQGAQVLAVDVSSAMVRALHSRAQEQGVRNLEVLALPIEDLALPAESVDLIVSSYALHHLRDPDKARLVAAAARWLRPGGRLVIADMMFGRGASARDRAIIKSKLAALARKGPGGWWRIVRNAARYLLRVQERPVSMDTWTAMLSRAGFAAVTSTAIVAEAGLVTGQRPGPQRAAADPGQ